MPDGCTNLCETRFMAHPSLLFQHRAQSYPCHICCPEPINGKLQSLKIFSKLRQRKGLEGTLRLDCAQPPDIQPGQIRVPALTRVSPNVNSLGASFSFFAVLSVSRFCVKINFKTDTKPDQIQASHRRMCNHAYN